MRAACSVERGMGGGGQFDNFTYSDRFATTQSIGFKRVCWVLNRTGIPDIKNRTLQVSLKLK